MEKIEVANPIRMKGYTLVPIEKTLIAHQSDEASVWCYGSKQLVALVVQTASGIQAHSLESGQMTISELRNIVPEIDSMLN